MASQPAKRFSKLHNTYGKRKGTATAVPFLSFLQLCQIPAIDGAGPVPFTRAAGVRSVQIKPVRSLLYRRQLRLYLIPAFEGLAVEDITTDDVQRLFNGMSGAKATKDKARMVLNQILDAAVEDNLISQNPAKSRRVKITGKASKATPPYTVEQMRYLVPASGT